MHQWGCSSAGRAPALQAGGQEFDPPHLHQGRRTKKTNVQKSQNHFKAQRSGFGMKRRSKEVREVFSFGWKRNETDFATTRACSSGG